jgi:hypothetical protein
MSRAIPLSVLAVYTSSKKVLAGYIIHHTNQARGAAGETAGKARGAAGETAGRNSVAVT